MAQRLTTKERNDKIKREYKIMNDQFIRPRRIYEVLAKKYWLKRESIQRICTDQYNRKQNVNAPDLAQTNSNKIVLEIVLRNNLKDTVYEN